MSITPSPQQAAAIASIVDWYRTRRTQQQVFRLFGYAGTGKSTITAAAIEALGLDPMARDRLAAAYGPRVLRRVSVRGDPCETRLIV
jgi:exodeoxyribonuclease-5